MPEKVNIKVPAHLAIHIKPDAPFEEKMKVISSGVTASPGERVTLLFFLCYDKNQEIKSAALSAIKGLPLSLVADVYADSGTHPKLKELLARIYPLSATEVAEREPVAESEEDLEEEPEEEPEEEENRRGR